MAKHGSIILSGCGGLGRLFSCGLLTFLHLTPVSVIAHSILKPNFLKHISFGGSDAPERTKYLWHW